MTSRTELPVGPVVPGWTPRPPAHAVPLTGRYVVLASLGPEHADDLYAGLCTPADEPLWTYRAEARPESPAAARAWVELARTTAGLSPFALLPREGALAGRASGLASYTRIEPAHGQVEIAGVLFARSLQRTRAATEAISLTMRHAFDTLGYRRFEWKCDALNQPSRRAAHRLGFRYEGRFRQHLVVKGRNRDTDWFSVTDAEWPAVRAAHDAWLDPANFEDDRQRTALSTLTAALR